MKTIAALIATAAISAPAFAGGPIATTEEVMVVPETVPYVAPGLDWSGAYVGGQFGYADVDSNDAGLDGYGWLGGVHAGYRWDMGTWVGGAEATWDTTNIELGALPDDTVDSVAALKLTAGREIGNSLVYGTVGGARAKANVGGIDLSDSGVVYGLGFDHALNDRMTVGGEVLQHNFNDFDGTGIDFDATTIKAKVGFRF